MAVPVKSTMFLRRKPRVTEVMGQSRGDLTDLSGNHKVQMQWNLNEAAKRDNVFRLVVDEKVVYIDLDELLFYTRTIAKT